MNLEQLKAQHPDLVKALQDEGAASERARIQAVQSALIPGHEKLISALMFDGKTSGGEAALQVNAAERAIREQQGKANNDAAPSPVAQVPAPTVNTAAAPAPDAEQQRIAALPLEDRCKARWDANADNVRDVYTSLAAYTAYERAIAANKVKQLRKTA